MRGVPVIAEMRTSDSLDVLGLSASQTVTLYSYRDGYFDTREREFRGFARVRVTSLGDDLHETEVTDTHFHVGRNLETGADEEVLKGKPYIQVVKNAAGSVYSAVETLWEARWLCQRDLDAGALPLLPDCDVIGESQEHKDELVSLGVQVGALNGTWEKTGNPKYTWTAQEYDAWGNTIATDALGEVRFDHARTIGEGVRGMSDEEGDEVLTRTAFLNQARPDQPDQEAWLIGLPVEQKVLDREETVRSHKVTHYDGAVGYESAAAVSTSVLLSALDDLVPGAPDDPSNLLHQAVTRGLVTREDVWLDTDGSWIRASGKAYDRHGQLIVALDANDNRREYEYDAQTGQFLVRESVEVEAGRIDFGAEYDRGFGQIRFAKYPLELSTSSEEADAVCEDRARIRRAWPGGRGL